MPESEGSSKRSSSFWLEAYHLERDSQERHLKNISSSFSSSSSLGSTAQLRPWPPPQNPAEFCGDFSTIFLF
jgi:hypothetical protein